ncbi:MAG: hypothetical protein EA352_05900 [Gemmatimonadales bacterium]|nr:MAG: hypothetical protein EA352_05900 [Gemmatimonadales bacterium]
MDSEPFRFISAGTVVPDADRIWNHSRWPFLISDLREMGKVTLLLAPGNDPGVAAVARIADRVFWLGDPRAASRDRDLLTLAIHPDSLAIPQVEDTGADPLADLPGGGEFQLEPEAPESGAEEVEVVGTASGLTGSAQETLSEKPEVAREARRKEAAARVHRSTTPPRPGSRSRGGRGGRLGLLLAILVVLVVLAIAGHYMEWLIVPGLPEVSPTP